MVTVYHYTSKEGAEAIEDTKLIRGSTGVNALFGDGVYVTDLPPDDKATKIDILLNNYDDGGDKKAVKALKKAAGHLVKRVVVMDLPNGWVEWIEGELVADRHVGIVRPLKSGRVLDLDLKLDEVTYKIQKVK